VALPTSRSTRANQPSDNKLILGFIGGPRSNKLPLIGLTQTYRAAPMRPGGVANQRFWKGGLLHSPSTVRRLTLVVLAVKCIQFFRISAGSHAQIIRRCVAGFAVPYLRAISSAGQPRPSRIKLCRNALKAGYLLASPYSPSHFQVIEPSAALAPSQVPLPFAPLRLPVPPTSSQESSASCSSARRSIPGQIRFTVI
jgi:hypothetical protein